MGYGGGGYYGDHIKVFFVFFFLWRSGSAETGRNIGSSRLGGRDGIMADKNTCGTGKWHPYMTRDIPSPPVRPRGPQTQPECSFWIWFKSWCLVLVFMPEELLEKISVTKSTNLLEGASRYDLILLCWEGLSHFNKQRLCVSHLLILTYALTDSSCKFWLLSWFLNVITAFVCKALKGKFLLFLNVLHN